MYEFFPTSVPGSRPRLLLLLSLLVPLATWPTAPAVAQEPPVFEIVQELDFDEPEAWAMKYFTSASLMSSLGPVESRDPWTVRIKSRGRKRRYHGRFRLRRVLVWT